MEDMFHADTFLKHHGFPDKYNKYCCCIISYHEKCWDWLSWNFTLEALAWICVESDICLSLHLQETVPNQPFYKQASCRLNKLQRNLLGILYIMLRSACILILFNFELSSSAQWSIKSKLCYARGSWKNVGYTFGTMNCFYARNCEQGDTVSKLWDASTDYEGHGFDSQWSHWIFQYI
jgi:hypothetical protein